MTEVTNNELADALLVLEAKDAATLVILRLAADRLRSAPSVSDSAGWIEWNGGECPLEKGVPVAVKLRDGRIVHGYALASPWLFHDYWIPGNNAFDIVAYRISK